MSSGLGSGKVSHGGATATSAKPPSMQNAATRSPAATAAPSGADRTVPATSLPGTNGSGGFTWYSPRLWSTSGNETPAASTSTTTPPSGASMCSGPGSGTSTSFRLEGPDSSTIWTARTVAHPTVARGHRIPGTRLAGQPGRIRGGTLAKQARDLNGRVVAITGGARGIGRATAEALLRAGARVAIGDIDAELARRTAAEINADSRAYHLDVTSRPSFATFLDSVEHDLGPLDVLVNNAGIMPVGAFLEESDAAAVRQLDINVHGVLFGMKEALPRMLPRRTGHVVNLASVAGKGGFPHLATYCATKHAVIGATEALRMEHRNSGVEFSCVMPALVDTELTSGVKAGRGLKKARAEDVADAIVDVLREPRFDVFVPREVVYISKFMALLPRRGAEAVARLLEADKLMVQADMGGRAAYEQRVAHSEPSPLETADPAAENAPEQPVA